MPSLQPYQVQKNTLLTRLNLLETLRSRCTFPKLPSPSFSVGSGAECKDQFLVRKRKASYPIQTMRATVPALWTCL